MKQKMMKQYYFSIGQLAEELVLPLNIFRDRILIQNNSSEDLIVYFEPKTVGAPDEFLGHKVIPTSTFDLPDGTVNNIYVKNLGNTNVADIVITTDEG